VKDKTFWDGELGGFGLRVREGGSRNWIVQYDIAGRSRRVTLGSTAMLDAGAARSRARDLLAKVRLGVDPAAEKREALTKAGETFRALLPRYLAKVRAECRPRTFKEIDARLDRLARPLHTCPLTSIDRRAISNLIAEVTEKNGSGAATNLRSSLSGYFSWLIQAGLLEANPVVNATSPAKRPSRERVISADELRMLWRALGADEYGDIVRLLVYTGGARRQEIGGLRWSEVDLDVAQIEIPAARMKAGRSHVIPLSEPALAILRRRASEADHDRDHVFGRGPVGFQSWSYGRQELNTRIPGKRPDWVLHDLRRLVSTTMHGQLGIPPHVVERILAHVQGGVAGIYNKADYLDERRRALERWADWVDAVVSGKQPEGKVVNLRRGKGAASK
jgi:integrase